MNKFKVYSNVLRTRFFILRLIVFFILAGGLFAALYGGGLAGIKEVFANNSAGTASGAGGPGSADDPLIARSAMIEYVGGQFDQRLPGFMENVVKPFVDGRIEEEVKKLEQEAGAPGQWKVVELKSGQRLVGGAGAEFIVRTGQAAVVDPTTNGIPDVTSGSSLTAGKAVPNNHLFVIPRDDGRGIQALTSSVWVMYKGQVNIN